MALVKSGVDNIHEARVGAPDYFHPKGLPIDMGCPVEVKKEEAVVRVCSR